MYPLQVKVKLLHRLTTEYTLHSIVLSITQNVDFCYPTVKIIESQSKLMY